MAKIYFNPKYHDEIFFRVLPLLFEKVYFNGEHAKFNDYLISLCQKEIVIPVFNSPANVPSTIGDKHYICRPDIVPDEDYQRIMEELYAIGPKKKFAYYMKKEYTDEELQALFDITNWDLTIAAYLEVPELGFDDMLTLRRKLLVESTNLIEKTQKPLAVTGFLEKRNVSLPTDLREQDISDFRQERHFIRFNQWVDEKMEKHETHPTDSNIELPDVMVNDYQQLVNTYSSRRAGQGTIAGAIIGIAALQLGASPEMGIIVGSSGGTISAFAHRLFAKEKWVYWVMNVESVKRYE